MKERKIMSITLLFVLGIITIFGSCKTFADENESDIEEKCYLGTVVDAGDNDYSKSDKIDKDDIHSGWQLGQFYVSGFTQKSKDSDGNFVFLKNVGDKIKLYFNLEQNIDKLNGRAFERYLTVQFRHLGYHVTLTSYSHDYGADLVLRKWGKKIVVQAKRYERNVGIAAVQEVVGSIAYYKADRAMVVTNSNFTKSARDLAKRNEVELWGRKEMQKKFHIKA